MKVHMDGHTYRPKLHILAMTGLLRQSSDGYYTCKLDGFHGEKSVMLSHIKYRHDEYLEMIK